MVVCPWSEVRKYLQADCLYEACCFVVTPHQHVHNRGDCACVMPLIAHWYAGGCVCEWVCMCACRVLLLTKLRNAKHAN